VILYTSGNRGTEVSMKSVNSTASSSYGGRTSHRLQDMPDRAYSGIREEKSAMERRSMGKNMMYMLSFSIFLALFGAIYELFSHGVYSYFMIYAFAFPLVLGVAVYMFLSGSRHKLPGELSCTLYNAGIVCLAVGSIVRGILEIYGTTNHLSMFYWPAGAVLIIAGMIRYIFE